MQKLPCMVKLKPWVLSHLFAKAQNSPKPKGTQSYCCSKLSLFVESSQQLEAMLANQKKGHNQSNNGFTLENGACFAIPTSGKLYHLVC